MPQAPVLTARLLSHVERNDSFASNRSTAQLQSGPVHTKILNLNKFNKISILT